MRQINEHQLIEKFKEGLEVKDLAQHFQCGENTIRRRLRKLQIKLPQVEINKKTKELDDEWLIQKYYVEKLSAQEIGKLIGSSKRPILSRIKKLKITRNTSQAATIRMSNPENREKISRTRLGRFHGENSPRWKGGKTKLNILIRQLVDYKKWRNEIYQRDNFTCVICHKTKIYLNADHIKPLSKIVREYNITTLQEARNCGELWDINNGRTLCVACHRKTDTFAGKCK